MALGSWPAWPTIDRSAKEFYREERHTAGISPVSGSSRDRWRLSDRRAQVPVGASIAAGRVGARASVEIRTPTQMQLGIMAWTRGRRSARRERRSIPHHQLDVLDTETATVARYQRPPRRDIEATASPGAVPVVVGRLDAVASTPVLDD